MVVAAIFFRQAISFIRRFYATRRFVFAKCVCIRECVCEATFPGCSTIWFRVTLLFGVRPYSPTVYEILSSVATPRVCSLASNSNYCSVIEQCVICCACLCVVPWKDSINISVVICHTIRSEQSDLRLWPGAVYLSKFQFRRWWWWLMVAIWLCSSVCLLFHFFFFSGTRFQCVQFGVANELTKTWNWLVQKVHLSRRSIKA